MKLCSHCFIGQHSFDPEMGDDAVTFEPGTCQSCGTVGIVFELVF